MALNLSTILQSVYQSLGELNMGLATGGSTTTVADSALANTSRDNVWKEGALFIMRDAAGGNALPEGQFQRISAYTNSTGTFTVDTAFTTAAAAGDLYGVASSFYPLRQVIQAVNESLTDLGDVDLVDTTTLDTVDTTTEYAAAVAWKRSRPYRIDIQTLTNSSTDNQWRQWHGWDYVPAAGGSTGLIIFYEYQFGSRDIRVWYRDKHPTLAVYSDVVNEAFDPEMVKRAALLKTIEWQVGRNQGNDDFLVQKLTNARQDLENRRVTNPGWRMKRGPKLMIVGPRPDDDYYDDVATP